MGLGMNSSKPILTLIFATYNGSHTLPRMLNSLLELNQPPDAWNIIAVDNGSSDATSKILNNYLSKLPLTILDQPERGKNKALNLALKQSLGDLVVFTDDDVIADRTWLTVLHECAVKHPEVDIFGGAILPFWETPPEEWIIKSIPESVAFAITDPTIPEGPVSPGLIWGPNMMVRRTVFDAGHRFKEDIGPTKGMYIMGSETEFTVRVVGLGHKTWFCPLAQVQHIIRTHQLNRDWIMKRAIRYGRSEYLQALKNGNNEVGQSWMFSRLNFPRWMFADFVLCFAKGHLQRLLGDRENWARLLWQAYIRLGYMYQAQSKSTRKSFCQNDCSQTP